MGVKKNPYSFTIGFNAKNTYHVEAVQILNRYGRGEKADYIARAILAYEGKCYEANSPVDKEMLRLLIRQIMEEDFREGKKQEEEIKTVVDVSEKVAKDPEVAQCLSRGLAAFRNS